MELCYAHCAHVPARLGQTKKFTFLKGERLLWRLLDLVNSWLWCSGNSGRLIGMLVGLVKKLLVGVPLEFAGRIARGALVKRTSWSDASGYSEAPDS